MEGTKQKRPIWWKQLLIVVGSVLLIICLIAGVLLVKVAVFADNYYAPVPDKIQWTGETAVDQPLRANGRGVYDADGNRVTFRGINFGNWLITEGWLCTHSVGLELDKDGNPTKVNENGIVESYKESFYQDELDILTERFGKEKADKLVDIYQDNFIQEVDFVNVKQLGFNTVRLPMYFGNFMELDANNNYVMKNEWYKRLDWFLEQCKANNLYATLDMHGVEGGQNGYEHSGLRTIDFWTNEKAQEDMCVLWKTIAERYATVRKDLSQTIGAYDLMNEPVDRNTPSTTRKQAAVMDKLYRAIREVDTQNHLISVEFCWMFGSCIDPSLFGWNNVMYQLHMYNWNSGTISYDMFYWAQDLTYSFKAFDVPYLIGEFTFFDNEAEWDKWLAEYDKRGFGWTIWNYKAISVGDWDTSWGLYVNKMCLGAGELKVDITTATYEEIAEAWSKVGTVGATNPGEYDDTGVLYKIVQDYFNKTK